MEKMTSTLFIRKILSAGRTLLLSAVLCFLIFLLPTQGVFADPLLLDDEDYIPLEIPLAELPFNYENGFQFPGMRQSFAYSQSWSVFIHENLGYFLEASGFEQTLSFIAVGFFDLYLERYIPGGSEWLKIESKRSILAANDISSYNNIYDFEREEKSFYISKVEDEDLINLKAAKPQDYIRLSSVSYESIIQSNKDIHEKYFISGRHPKYILPYMWINFAEIIVDISDVINGDCDEKIDEMNLEQLNESDRDIFGCDYTSWVYSLYNPEESLIERGTHSSGIGIDRYIKYEDLSDAEKDYLKKMRLYSIVNMLSPSVFAMQRFPVGNENEIFWNFAFYHYLAPFGHSIDFKFFLKLSDHNYFLTLNYFENNETSFPGIELSAGRIPLEIKNFDMMFSGSLSAWFQPEDLSFTSKTYSPGGAFSFDLIFPINYKFELFSGVCAKTSGWKPGYISLESNLAFTAGLNIMI